MGRGQPAAKLAWLISMLHQACGLAKLGVASRPNCGQMHSVWPSFKPAPGYGITGRTRLADHRQFLPQLQRYHRVSGWSGKPVSNGTARCASTPKLGGQLSNQTHMVIISRLSPSPSIFLCQPSSLSAGSSMHAWQPLSWSQHHLLGEVLGTNYKQR